MPSASRSAWASVRATWAQLLSARTDTMGITRMPALPTVTTVLATSPEGCSSVQARGSAAASADVDLGAGSTAVASTLAVEALTVADLLVVAQWAAASAAVLHTKQSAAERFAAAAQYAAVAADT